jgi:hypothetical protein
MSDASKTFPLLATGYDRKKQDAPIMLDGMEVMFERTVGLYPVTLDPKKAAADVSEASSRRRATAKRNGNGVHRRNGPH